MYYVYLLIDPTTNQPFYCGKGTRDRWKSHFGYWSGNGKNNPCENKIKSLRAKGIEPTVQFLVENIKDEQEAYQIEENYIRENYDRLVNIKIEARPPSAKGRIPWNKNKKMPDSVSKNQSNRLKEEYKNGTRIHWTKTGKFSEDEISKLISNGDPGKSNRGNPSKSRTPIIELTTGIIFESQTQAANYFKLRQGDIANILKGRGKTIKGYTFAYTKINLDY